jgi:hypothetical protein
MKKNKKMNVDVDIKLRQNGFMLLVGKFQNCYVWILMTRMNWQFEQRTLVEWSWKDWYALHSQEQWSVSLRLLLAK